MVTAQYQRVREACEAAGRDPGSITYSFAHVVCVGANEAEFARRAADLGRDPDKVRQSPLAGTIAEVIDTLQRWSDAAAERAYLQVLNLRDLDHIALIAAEVLPALREYRPSGT